jgi:predicted phage replisome organizer
MPEIRWIKIVTDMFANRKIKQIEKMPDADSILVIWLKILCLAGTVNENGLLLFTRGTPYTQEMMASDFNRPIETIRLALTTFEKFGMIETVSGVYCVLNWEKYQNADGMAKIREQTRRRVEKYRKENREKQAKTICNATSNVTGNVTVTLRNAIEEDIDIEKEKTISPSISPPSKKAKVVAEKPVKKRYGEFQRVTLTDEEYQRLATYYGERRRDQIIQDMDEWSESNGKTKASYCATAQNWARRNGWVKNTGELRPGELSDEEHKRQWDEYHKRVGI